MTYGSREPVTAEGVMRAYEGLVRRSRRMAESARTQDWETLIEEESQYVLDVEWLSCNEPLVRLDEHQQARKLTLLEDILQREQSIRECLATRREELDQLIGMSRRQRDLNRSYRSHGAAVLDGRVRFEKGRP